ncbi:hypothetical protein K488DRAFT_72493 [Vararia minispora EC-137]|uniref:Uncharacterized protein n=1 Tax=Vararia minispora EC-137 TaxID=1314806 RepID=A0ACB8QEQ9_9AGAM|nr:hypothetical protein K488DRAFT_72493 [Vararia minispora EC-137]
MTVVDSFRTNATTCEVGTLIPSTRYSAWPEDVTGLERIMLMARGELQRLLSTFFAETISIKTIYANTSPRTTPASPEQPITQKREVHLVCKGKTVCVATSTVTLTSPECERLFLDDKYAVGQMFRKMGTPANFDLLDTGVCVDDVTGKRELWRRYVLAMPGFECEIVETFPDRDMFTRGAAWLTDEPVRQFGAVEAKRRYANNVPVMA